MTRRFRMAVSAFGLLLAGVYSAFGYAMTASLGAAADDVAPFSAAAVLWAASTVVSLLLAAWFTRLAWRSPRL